MAKSWDKMTVEEKLDYLRETKANQQNLSFLSGTVGEIGNAVKKIEKEVSEMKKKK